MKPTRRTKITTLLKEALEDPSEDLATLSRDLHTWAVRLGLRSESRWADGFDRPDRGGRPRAASFLGDADPARFLDDAEPAFRPALFEHFAGLVRKFRPLARRVRNPATFRARVPSGRDLLGSFPSGDAEFQEMFRKRFTALAADLKTPPQLAAASLVLLYGQADDSPDEAARLVERLKKQGKTRPK